MSKGKWFIFKIYYKCDYKSLEINIGAALEKGGKTIYRKINWTNEYVKQE